MSTSPYTPFNTERAFKPVAGVTRYIGIEGGSFFDAILRGFFGYNPPMVWPATTAATNKTQMLEQMAIREPTLPRGFNGRLMHLRTPLGLATITSGAQGLVAQLE